MQRQLGCTGEFVHPMGLGAMPLSIQGRPSPEQAFDVIKAYVDGGGNFIDTANAYCLDDSDIGHNERLIDGCLKRLGARDRVRVATKGGLMRPQGRWETNGRPEFIRESCENSLRDLDTDRIDLYQLHAVDPKVPFSETLGELALLQQQGKIQYIGLSNISATQLQSAMMQITVVSVQNRCNPLESRDFRTGLVDLCAELDVSYIPHSPVGGHYGHKQLAANATMQRLAAKYSISPYQVALAWFLNKGDHILPIPGASKVASIVDSMAATSVSFSDDDMTAIDDIAR